MNNRKPVPTQTTQLSDTIDPPENQPVILIGIDWADREHEFALTGPDGKFHTGSFDQKPDAIAEFLDQWRNKLGVRQIVISVETTNGPLINALMEHSDITILPVNPSALGSYRKAFAHGGGKNDEVDARLILQFLTHYRHQLRPLQIGSPQTRTLTALVRDRREFVQQRVALSLQLMALLKGYFPAVLAMTPAKPYADFVVKLIARYPTLDAVRKAGRARIRKLFYGLGTRERIEQRIAALFENMPLTTDQVLLECGACKAQVLAAQLEILNQSIRQYDRRIRQVLQQHDRFQVFDSLPCGNNSKARLIAALGDDLLRFGSAQELAAAVGIAPITTQSGKSRYVSSRWACSKFLRQTFHEFAGITIPRCAWSKAFYESQLARGKSARMAKRALANKWIRIIFRCWQSGTPYNEARYVKQLKANQSPLFAKIAS